jgi:DNA-binding NarL/FixJ family response regulator
VREGIHCGADGYLLKNSSPQDLQAAIKAVHCNHAFFSPAVSRIIIDDYNKRGISLAVSVDEHSAIPNRLTAREREILQLIAGGKTHQEIAEVLHISVRTVDTHRNNIIQKLDLHSTASLVTYAIKNGIVILPM